MAFYSDSVEDTCTAQQICGWSLTSNHTSGNEYTLSKLRELRKLSHSDFRDFKVLFVFITESQLNATAKKILEMSGFQHVFEGTHEDGCQRHEETGSLHIFATCPRDFSAHLDVNIKKLENEIKKEKEELEKQKDLNLEKNRNQFPSKMFRTQMRREGILKTNSTKDLSLRFGLQQRGAELLEKFYGVKTSPQIMNMSISNMQKEYTKLQKGLPNAFTS